MKLFLQAVTMSASIALAGPAAAALAAGTPAADFSVQSVQGSETTPLRLSELLTQGPVVVFFLPYIYSGASASECRAFADSIDAFRAAGATVIGMSRDPSEDLARFSANECAGKIPMVSADPALVNSFDVNDSANFATRTTYVIAPSGEIVFVYNQDDHSGHASRALAFVQGMSN